ncbi:MAG: Txe/YoeB family addiction module toxin [Bacteroidetes bacterium]|nr:Txe/YoeB family addiction module toxin [Bacteroidota bacterium]
MKLVCSEGAWEDYLFWQAHDRQILTRINTLIREMQRTPFSGTGKPEPLRHALAGCWSRRISEEHRLVYKVTDDTVQIVQLRYHY